MSHAIIQVIKGQPQAAAQTPGERNEALGLLALCWLLAAGVFIAVKWAGTYTLPWTRSSRAANSWGKKTEQQEDNTRLLQTIDAVTEKFGKHLLQVGVSRKPGK